MSEVKELQEQVTRLKRDSRDSEENLRLLTGPHGDVGKAIRELKAAVKKINERLTAIEDNLQSLGREKTVEIRQESKQTRSKNINNN